MGLAFKVVWHRPPGLCSVLILAVCTIATAGPFTPEQSTAGRAAYQANCESCHLADLAGRNEAPPLAGSNFIATWRARSTRELISFIQTTMPPGNAGGLGQETYVAIAAFLLEA